MKRSAIVIAAAVFALCVAGGEVWGQSRMPAEPTNYLVAAYRGVKGSADDWHGDTDKIAVIFFEVDASVTGTLHFGIYDPGIDATDWSEAERDPGDMRYELYGDSGAYSNATAKYTYYTNAADARTGTLLESFDVPEATSATGTYNNLWVYFPGVNPAQGELVGNKRYFKVVVEAKTGSVEQGGSATFTHDYKNMYQVAASTVGSGSPTSVSGVRAFAYSLPLGLDGTQEWDLYPFVPDKFAAYPSYPTTPVTFAVMAHNHDMDYSAGNTLRNSLVTGYDRLGGSWNVIMSGGNTNGVDIAQGGSSIGKTIASSSNTNGTWRLHIYGGNEGYPADGGVNGADFWFSADASGTFSSGAGSGAVDPDAVALKIYSAAWAPPQPDHVAIAPATATVAPGVDQPLQIQIVSSDGTPLPYSRKVFVSAGTGAIITPDSTTVNTYDELVTTDSDGIFTIKVRAATPQTITVSLVTNGTNGSDTITGSDNGKAVITVGNALPPTISSSADLTFTEGNAQPLTAITITEKGLNPYVIYAGTVLLLKIPESMDANFDTGATVTVNGLGTTMTYLGYDLLSAGSKVVSFASPVSRTTGQTLAVAGLALTSINGGSSGLLQLSSDGGQTWISDDKLITIQPNLYVWDGSSSGDWNDGTNWVGNSPPPVTATARIPVVGTYPAITTNATSATIKNLIIDSGARVTLNFTSGSPTLTVTGTLSNSGTIYLTGAETLSVASGSGDSGTITYTGGGVPLVGIPYYNLTINGGGSYSLSGNLTVNGTLTLTAGTLLGGTSTITVYGNWSDGGGTFTPGSSTVAFAGTATATITGGTTFSILSCLVPGKTLKFEQSATFTVNTFRIQGSSAEKVYLRSTADTVAWNLTRTTVDVKYANLKDSQVAPASDAIYSTLISNTGGWTAPTVATWLGGSPTWSSGPNWSTGTKPTAATSVIIPVTTNNPVLDEPAFALNLTIASGASLTLSGNSLDISAGGIFSNDGTLRLRGSETLQTGGGAFVNDTDSGTVQYNDTAAGLTLKAGSTYYDLSFTGTGTWTHAGTLTVNHNLTQSAGTLSAGATAMSVSGNINLSGATAFSHTGTLTMQPAVSASLQTGTVSLGSLSVASGTVTLSNALSLTGSLGISAGATLDVSSFNYNVSLAGNWTNGGTFTARNGTVSFTSGSATTHTVTPGTSVFRNLATASTSTADFGSNDIALSGTLSNVGAIQLTGAAGQDITLPSGNDTTQGTWKYTGAGGTIKDFGATDYYNLTVAGSAPASAFALNADMVVNSILTVSGGYLNSASPRAITLSDADFSTTAAAAIDTGSNGLTLIAPANRSVALGTATGAADLELINSELLKIAASSLSITTSGSGTISANSIDTTTAVHGLLTLSNTQALTFTGTNTFDDGLAASTSLVAGISLGGATELIANTAGSGVSLGRTAAAGSALTITADEIDFSGGVASVSGTGTLTLRSKTAAQPFAIGAAADSGVGTLDLTSGDIDAFKTGGFSSVTLGVAPRTATITASTAISGITTSLIFAQPLVVAEAATASISTTGGLTFSSNVDGTAGGAGESLTLTAGASGFSFTGGIGGTAALYDLTLTSGAALALPATTLTHDLSVTTTSGAITDAGVLTVPGTLVLSSAGAITLDNANLIGTVGSVTRGGAFTLVDTAGGLTLTGPVTAGITTNAVDITTSGAGTTLTVSGNITATTGGITLTADAMDLSGGSYSAGAAAIILRNYASTRPINLGAEVAGSLCLQSTELNRASTTGILTVGRDDANASGLVTVGGPIAPSGVTTVSIRTGGGISGAGQTITETNLAVRANGAVDVNLAATTIAISTATGGITLTSGSGGFAIGTVDGLSGITCQAGSNVILDAASAVTQTQPISAGAAGGLRLLGAGSFTLTSTTNQTGTIAANLTGTAALSYIDSDALTVGTIAPTVGITTAGGAVTLDTNSGADISLSSSPAVTAGNATITFKDPVVLTTDTSVSSGAGTGNIDFQSTLRGTTIDAEDLSLTAGTGNIQFQAAVGATRLGALTIVSASGGVTTSSTMDAASATIANGGSVDLNGTVVTPGGFSSQGSSFDNTGATITSAAGTIAIDASGLTTIGATITATGAGDISFGSVQTGTVLLGAGVTTAGGNVRFYRGVELAAGVTVAAGAGNVTFDGTVDAANAGIQTLTINSTGTTRLNDTVGATKALASFATNAGGTTQLNAASVTTSAAAGISIADNLSLIVDSSLNAGNAGTILVSGSTSGTARKLTVVNCASATFTGSVGSAGNLLSEVDLAATINTTSAIAFNGGLFATTFTVNAGAVAYDVTMGATGTVTNHVTFNNTGDLTFSAGFTFTNGATKSTAGVTHIAGTISSSDQPFTFNGAGGITLDNNATIDANATVANTADITLGAVTASTFTLTLETGNAVTNADVSGTSFTGGIGSGLSLANIGGTATFTGVVTAVDLTVPNTVANISLQGMSGTITNLVEFHNTGTLRLGSAAGTLTFNGGVSTVAAPAVGGTVTLYGTIATSNDPISFGAVALGAATVLNPGTGQIDLASIPSTANFNLDIRGTGVANLGSAGQNFLLGTGALVLSNKSTGSAITIDGTTVTLGSITPPATAQTFDLTFNANTVTVTAAATLTNVGGLTLGNADTDTFNFNGGLTKIGTNAVHIRGTLDTSSAPGAVDLTTSGGIVLYGVTTVKTGTANLQFGAVSCDVVAGHNLVIYASGVGTATIASANLGTGGSLDLSNRSSTGTFTMSGSLTALDLVAPSAATAFALTLNGGSTTNGVDLTNQTGTLTINSGGFSFNGGATKPTGNITLAGGSVLTNAAAALNFGTSGTISVTANTTIGGDAAIDTGTITLSTVNISATFTLALGSGTENSSYSITGAVNGGGSLTINTVGGSGTITFGSNVGAGTALTTLTVTNSYGVEFQGTVQAGTVTLTDTADGRDIIFRGDLIATTGLTTGAQPFDLFFNAAAGTQTTTITGNTNLQIVSTGTITFGNNAGDVFIVNGTLTSNGTATRHLIGAIRTQAQTITFGSVTLDGDTTIDTTANGNLSYLAGATVSLGTVTGGANTLVVNAGTGGGFTQSAGTITADKLRIIADGNIGTAMATPINTAVVYLEAISYTGTIFVSNTGAYTVGFAGGDFETIGGAGGLSASAGMVTNASQAIGLAADAGNSITFSQTTTAGTTGAFTATANTLAINATITANGGINLYPNANALGIAINDASGTFSLTTAELANLASSGTLTVGLASGTGSNNAINIGSIGSIGLGAETYAVTLQAAFNPINFHFAATGNTLTLPAGRPLTLNAAGAVTTDSGGTSVDVTGATSLVYVQSVTSIGSAGNPLKTQIQTFRSDAGAGNVYLNETDALTIGDGTAGVSTSVGLVDILAGGVITISNPVTTTGTGTTIKVVGTSIAVGANVSVPALLTNQITLTATGGAITWTAGTVTTTLGVLALSATTNIGASGAAIPMDVATLRATASSGGIFIDEANAIQLGDGTGNISATSGEIRVTTTGAITTGNAIATTTSGNIALTAGGAGITITNNVTPAGSAAFNSAVTHSAGTITAGPISAGSTALLFTGSYNGAGGTLDGNGTTNPDIEFRGSTTLGTFNRNGDRVVFSGGASPLAFNSSNQALSDVLITGATNVRLTGSNVSQTGASLQIASGGLDLDTNNLYWRQDSTASAAPTAGAFYGLDGTLTLAAGSTLQSVAFTSELGHTVTNTGTNTITASGDVKIAGTFNNPATPANSTLVMTGAAATLDATPRIGNLTTQGNVTLLNKPLELQGSMYIQTGSLDVGANLKITLSGDWTNDVGFAGFLARTGEVEFTKAAGTIIVHGNNEWFNFRCEQSGITIAFEMNRTQRILAGGQFIVVGSPAPITLTRDDPSTADLDWVPPLPPNQALMWQIDVLPTATLLPTQNVVVSYSDARSHPVVASGSVTLVTVTPDGSPLGEVGATCYKWLTGLQAVYSYTEDTDGNGKIDRIRVTTGASLNFNFSDISVSVTGYAIDTAKGTNGFIPITTGTYASREFYIALVEKPYTDTGATPNWKIVSNNSLRDGGFNISKVTTVDPVMIPIDNAPPVLTYTLSLPGTTQTLMAFSENVFKGPSGTVIDAAPFSGPPIAGLTRLTSSGNGTSEALLNLSSAPTVADLIGPVINVANSGANGVYDYAQPSPVNYSLTNASLPAPLYQATGSAPPNAILHPTHRATDILISVPPSSAADSKYFVWPIWAKDSVITEIAGEDYEGLTPEEAASRTIGLVRDFTGTQWLRDQDITLQARVNAGLGTPSGLRLHFDTNVPETFLSTAANGPVGLWLPGFSQSDFSGLVPTPRSGTSTVSSAAPVAPLLWNLVIDSDDPKVKSVSVLDFFFTLDSAVNPLYVARLDIAPGAAIPADWYRRIKPFSFEIHDVKKQRSSVTILNNVIDPTKGERVRISYQLSKGGSTTIQVFTLDGDLVDVLYRGNRAAGDYTASWDGKNRGGRPVARGMYFIRVVGPEIDEIRKVMIVK